MKELIEYIAHSLVDEPSEVDVRLYHRGSQTNVLLRVAKNDMGRIIGKGGRVAGAMRMLLRVAAAHEGKRANLEIIEPE